jgi:hypothetical protein
LVIFLAQKYAYLGSVREVNGRGATHGEHSGRTRNTDDGVRRLYGRQRETVALAQVLDAAGRGRARFVSLEGAVGTGKSTLLSIVREDARRCGWTVLTGRAAFLESGYDFGVLRQLLATPHAPELPSGSAPDTRKASTTSRSSGRWCSASSPSIRSTQSAPENFAPSDGEHCPMPALFIHGTRGHVRPRHGDCRAR